MNGFKHCGGSIISRYFVLTAGHCIQSRLNYPVNSYSVLSGTNNWQIGGKIHKIAVMILHGGYTVINQISHNDIGLVRVQEPFEFGETTMPIQLFNQDEEFYSMNYQDWGVVSGWGKYENYDYLPYLRAVTIPILQKMFCWQHLQRIKIQERKICAGTKGRDACSGDSGAPLVIRNRQIGIVSNGAKYPYCGKIGFYTNVAMFRNWIDEYIESEKYLIGKNTSYGYLLIPSYLIKYGK